MSGSARVLRGLLHRGAATALLLLLAVIAAAAAAAAPAYEQAARSSIIDAVLTGSPQGGQLEVVRPVNSATAPAPAGAAVERVLASSIGASGAGRLFEPPVLTYEAVVPLGSGTTVLAARTGVCAHLHLVSGRCPSARGEVLESAQDARAMPAGAGHDRIGRLEVVGTYAPTDPDDPSWFGRYDVYFPPNNAGALFTDLATVAGETGGGTVVVDVGLRTPHLDPAQLAAADRAIGAVVASTALQTAGYSPVSVIAASVTTIHHGWSTLAVPTVLVTAELLVLAWMLLFLVVTEGVEARGSDVALAKLRGLPGRRVLATAVAEPLAVFALAVPIGAALGAIAARLLAHALLVPGTPVPLPWLSWVAAVAAVSGGVVAAVAAAGPVLRRGVLEQWQRTGRSGASRGWVFDAVLLTAAAAGLLDLGLSGVISSSSHSLQVELVPGLIALAAAVLASRLLPLGCRAAASASRRRGGLAAFLAMRHVARRPGGARTTIVLATAVAIALFGVAVASVGRTNRADVADQVVGAATVLTVQVPDGKDLATVVDTIDPSGRRATAVSTLTEGEGSGTVLAVDPQRFAAVASWLPGAPLGKVARDLAPPVPAPVVVDGDALRLQFADGPADAPAGKLSGVSLTGYVAAAGGVGVINFSASAGGVFTAPLTNCPCTLFQLLLAGPQGDPVSGTTVLSQVDVHGAGGWSDAGRAAVTSWQLPPDERGNDALAATPQGLRWSYDVSPAGYAELESSDFPDPLPVVAAAPAVGSVGSATPSSGLDGGQQLVLPVAIATSIPGAPADGVVVDRTYALRASGGIDVAQQQVWLAAGATSLIPRLRAAGLRITRTQTTAASRTTLDHQGPALAGALLLFDAAVAALLAALGATMSLVGAARRRRYEYASLIAGGATRWTIWRSIALEQLVVLGFGAVVGAAAGVAGMLLALRKVPVLQVPPTAPPLDFALPVGDLLVAMAVVLGVVALAAVVAATGLVRSVRPSALRESAP